MRALIRGGLALVILSLWTAGILEAQENWTKQDRQGPVSVGVTLMLPPDGGAPLKVKVVLDTHSVALDGIKFEEAVVLYTPDGAAVASTGVEQATGSGHHRQAVVAFPPLPGPGDVRIVVKGVGGIAERSFSWELPAAR